MNRATLFWWLSRIALAAVGVALLSAAWTYSAHEPAVRDPNSRWAPLAYSPDGKLVAAADLTGQRSWITEPGGPVHLLRAEDLTPAAPPIETPTIQTDHGVFHPSIEMVEFSANGDLLAVLQGNRDGNSDSVLELHLIRLDGGALWKSIPIPYDRWHKQGGIARRLFSSDGRLLAWHEYSSQSNSDTVRAWDVAEDRERFTALGMTYPVVSPDGSLLAAVERKRPEQRSNVACRLYETRDGRLVHALTLPGDTAGWQPWPEFSSDGRLLAVNCDSSTGGGQSVVVFDVASGKIVFEAKEWSPHFLSGPMFVSVKNDTIFFRTIDTWQVRAKASFSLGRHWENGSEISPEPVPVPGKAAVLVYDFYPATNARFAAIKRWLHLDSGEGLRGTWVDAASGATTQFSACESLVWRTSISPSGKRLLVQGTPDVTIWDLPPRRSWIPTAVTALVLASVYGTWILARRPRAIRS
jgi:WD40 repeat protein